MAPFLLPLQGTDGYAFGEPFLECGVDDECGDHDDDEAGEHQAEIAPVLRGNGYAREAEREGFERIGVDEHERVEVLVPYADEVEDGHGDEAGFGEREHDIPERANLRRAVNQRGFAKLVGYRAEKAGEYEYGER